MYYILCRYTCKQFQKMKNLQFSIDEFFIRHTNHSISDCYSLDHWHLLIVELNVWTLQNNWSTFRTHLFTKLSFCRWKIFTSHFCCFNRSFIFFVIHTMLVKWLWLNRIKILNEPKSHWRDKWLIQSLQIIDGPSTNNFQWF